MKRLLNPLTNPAGYTAAASFLLAVAQAVYNAQSTGQPITWQVLVTAGVGVLAAWARGKVTPVKDPRDGNGKPLVNWQSALSRAEQDTPGLVKFTGDVSPELVAAIKKALAEIPPRDRTRASPPASTPPANVATGVTDPPVPGSKP